jgi:hypothetical protein
MGRLEDLLTRITDKQLRREMEEALAECAAKHGHEIGRIESQRKELAQDANEAIAAFHEGKLKPQPVEEIIAELRQSLDETIEE